jgi:hypothetical protein
VIRFLVDLFNAFAEALAKARAERIRKQERTRRGEDTEPRH